MIQFVRNYSDFINEDFNFTRDERGTCILEDRWFFYNPDDDIIYGCEDKPVGDDSLFAFNPSSCTIIMNGEEKQYDINNPVCLISYNLDDEKVKIYTDDVIAYLHEMGFSGDDFQSQHNKWRIRDIFENDDNAKHILISGNEMVASTFDVIEEN